MLIANKIDSGKNYGCLMLETNFKNWERCLNIVSDDMTYDDDKHKFGKEHNPHVSILFGFDIPTTDREKLKSLVLRYTGNKPIEFKILAVNYFEGSKFDVLKFDVESKALSDLNKLCAENFDYSSDFVDYHPHITISYIKKGLLDKSYDYKFKQPFTMKGDKFFYTTKINDSKNIFRF